MITLVQHGEPKIEFNNIILGQLDPPLRTILRNKRIAKDYYFDTQRVVLCSPLRRAVETAALFGYDDVILDRRVMELNLGNYQGLPKNERNNQLVYELHSDQTSNPHNGETFEEFYHRVRSFWDDYKDRDVIVFTHSRVIRVLISNILQLANYFYQIDFLDIININNMDSTIEFAKTKVILSQP